MKLVLGTPLGSTNSKINIRNLPTHYLLKLYYTGQKWIWGQGGGQVVTTLSKKQRLAIHNLLRLRMVVKGSLKGQEV